MSGNQAVIAVVMAIFGVDALLMAGLILWKTIHRKRVEDHDRRRSEYLGLLTAGLLARQVSFPDRATRIGQKVARDPAFLDAVIDLRQTLAGQEVDTLSDIIGRYDLAERQAVFLRRRFPKGRRLMAAVSLAEMGDEQSVHVLIEHLNDREPEVRIQCARGLVRMNWTPAIDAIVDRLNVESPWVRARFVDTLVGFGDKATWPLVAYIRVNHKYETAGPVAAIKTLATIGDYQAGPPLVEVLEQANDIEVKIAVVESLGSVGGPAALAPLEGAHESEDWRLRAKAATAMGEVGYTSAIPALASGLSDPNWWVRRNSAAALAQIPGGIPELFKALDSVDLFARDSAAEALSDAGELIESRRRFERGEPTETDLVLLYHMASDVMIAS